MTTQKLAPAEISNAENIVELQALLLQRRTQLLEVLNRSEEIRIRHRMAGWGEPPESLTEDDMDAMYNERARIYLEFETIKWDIDKIKKKISDLK